MATDVGWKNADCRKLRHAGSPHAPSPETRRRGNPPCSQGTLGAVHRGDGIQWSAAHRVCRSWNKWDTAPENPRMRLQFSWARDEGLVLGSSYWIPVWYEVYARSSGTLFLGVPNDAPTFL